MRIIKEGKLPGEKLYIVTCRTCNTEFEFAHKEAKCISNQRDGDYLSISCPLCKELASVNPYHYKDK